MDTNTTVNDAPYAMLLGNKGTSKQLLLEDNIVTQAVRECLRDKKVISERFTYNNVDYHVVYNDNQWILRQTSSSSSSTSTKDQMIIFYKELMLNINTVLSTNKTDLS